jgi:hypothetical protein
VSHKDIVAAVVATAAAVLAVVCKGPVCPNVTMKNIQKVIKICISVVSTAKKFLKTYI